MTTISLKDSKAVAKRLQNCQQDVADFLTGITKNIHTDFEEFCDYINIVPCGIAIRSVDAHSPKNSDSETNTSESQQDDKLIQFTISLEISEGLLQFLSTIFTMIDAAKLISLCIVNNRLNQSQLEILQAFQQKFATQLYCISVHHVANNEDVSYLNMISWNSLKIISLKNDNLTDNECSIICNQLQDNPKLTALNLDFNQITCNGFIELINCILEKCPSILVLSIAYNDIDDQGLEHLQTLIEGNNGLNSLRIFRMKFNKFSTERVDKFKQFVEQKQINCKILI